jgi:AraC-like DNA-binding protein
MFFMNYVPGKNIGLVKTRHFVPGFRKGPRISPLFKMFLRPGHGEGGGYLLRTIKTAKPRPELSEFVEVYAQREMDCGDAVFSQANSSSLQPGIGFHFDGQTLLDYPDGRTRPGPKTYVFGGLTPPCGGTSFSGHILAFAIFLKPLSLWPLFRIPSNVIFNRDYDAELLLGREILDLWSKLAECETFEARVLAAERYLLPFASRSRGRTLITRTAHHMLDCKGAVRIDEIADQARLSMRQYERRFLEEIGLTPKTFARTARFQRALDAKRFFPCRTWLSIAHEFGYFDQMHMVRDFQLLCGVTPNNFLDLSGDIQPWSLPAHKALELR